jgi:hypothetical protein
VNDLLAWLEGSALGHAMRGAGVWSYGVVNLIHILGVSTLFGSLLLLDLRLLGLWRRLPLASIATPVVPLARAGFAVAAASGACLIVSNATEYAGNPFLLIKFSAIGVGLLNVVVLERLAGWRARSDRALSTAESRRLAISGGVSLLAWSVAIGSGRLIGYW